MSTDYDFQSLPSAIIRAISTFCKPEEVCLLAATCRRIQRSLMISILAPPFAKWRRRVNYVGPVQEIMRLPTFFHDRPYYVRLVFGVYTMQDWGPWTRFFIVAKPGNMDETEQARCDDGNKAAFVARLPLLMMDGNRVDILMEPNQTYFLYGENKANSTAQIHVEAKKFLVFDTDTFCFRQVYKKATELEQAMMQKLHPFEAKFPTFGACKSPAPYFFSNIFSMILDTSDICSMHRFFWSDTERNIDMDMYQEMKLFLRACDQLMQSSQATVGNDQFSSPGRAKSSLTTLPPIRFVADTIGWAKYQIMNKVLLRIPMHPNTKKIRINAQFHVAGTIQLNCLVLKQEGIVGKIMTPTIVMKSNEAKDGVFLVTYQYDLYPNTASCLLEFEPEANEETLKDLEIYLFVEKEGGDLEISPSSMEERLRNLRGYRNTLPCWRSFSRLLNVFSAAVTLEKGKHTKVWKPFWRRKDSQRPRKDWHRSMI